MNKNKFLKLMHHDVKSLKHIKKVAMEKFGKKESDNLLKGLNKNFSHLENKIKTMFKKANTIEASESFIGNFAKEIYDTLANIIRWCYRESTGVDMDDETEEGFNVYAAFGGFYVSLVFWQGLVSKILASILSLGRGFSAQQKIFMVITALIQAPMLEEIAKNLTLSISINSGMKFTALFNVFEFSEYVMAQYNVDGIIFQRFVAVIFHFLTTFIQANFIKTHKILIYYVAVCLHSFWNLNAIMSK